jgi:hypothetical protein
VLNNEEIERNRIERRAQQAEERRMRDDLKGLDPGNPNWEFFKMIRDYRATLDFRPLRSTDAVIDDRICVCVRKRPLGKKEKDKKEIDVGYFWHFILINFMFRLSQSRPKSTSIFISRSFTLT